MDEVMPPAHPETHSNWRRVLVDYGGLSAIMLAVAGGLWWVVVAQHATQTQVARIEERFGAIDLRFKAIEDRLTKIETAVEDARKRDENILVILTQLQVGQARIEEQLKVRR